MTVLHKQRLDVLLIDAPWENVTAVCDDLDDNARLTLDPQDGLHAA